jgi:mgtE-like transporter
VATDERPRRPRLPRVPGPIRVLGRAFGLTVNQVGAYWYQERVAIRRGMGALLLAAFTGMIAGAVLAGAEETLEALPGLLLLVPAAIDMRGNIYGALASRLSTAIHLGEYERELRWRGFLGRQIEATSYLTIGTSVVIAGLAYLFAAVLRLPTISVWQLLVIATIGGALSSVFLLVLTVAMSRFAHSQDWNMDDVAAPTITVAGDVLTVPALLLATVLVRNTGFATVLGIVLAVLGVAALVAGWIRRQDTVRRIVRESAPTLAAATAVGILAGTILESRVEELLDGPWLLVLIPPFVATCGSLGGMLSSRLASKLHLGVIQPRWVPGGAALLDGSLTLLFGTFAFSALAVTTWGWSTIADHSPPELLGLFGIALLAGIISIVLLIAVAYTTAAASYRFGLDPDNEGIPIVTSAMDLLGLLTLVGVVTATTMG